MRYRIYVSLVCLLLGLLVACQSDKGKQAGSQQQPIQSNTTNQSNTTKQLPSGQLTYVAPEGWVKQQPSSSMRKDQYALPGVDGAGDGEMVVFFFPGAGGGVEDNLKRWYGQFKQPDGSATEEHVELKQVTANNLPVTLAYVTGTYLQSTSPMMMGGPVEERPDYSMLAAIVETAEAPWFFKATGPKKTIDHWRPSFDAFVKTFRVE